MCICVPMKRSRDKLLNPPKRNTSPELNQPKLAKTKVRIKIKVRMKTISSTPKEKKTNATKLT